MQYQITIPQAMPDMTVKMLLEDYFLIPRKIRHFLRTKKHVLVNRAAINWQSPIKPGDVLTLIFDESDYPPKNIPFGDASLVNCLYEDQHLIVVNKPEGLKTHGNAPDEIALLNHVSAYVGDTCYVVHRLDKETSGAILFAKNPFVLPILNRLLEDKQIARTYLALVAGSFELPELCYTDKIGRNRHDPRKRLVTPQGQAAITHVSVKSQIGQHTLIQCQLETGRTHQIRVHLSHHGHAILGDPLYSKLKAPRLMLHAQELSFIHPFTLEQITVTADSQSFNVNL